MYDGTPSRLRRTNFNVVVYLSYVKIIITKQQYKKLVYSLLDTIVGGVLTVQDHLKDKFTSIYDSEDEHIMSVFFEKGSGRNKGCKRDLTLDRFFVLELQKYVPYFKNKIFSKSLVDYVYDKTGIKCDCVDYPTEHIEDSGYFRSRFMYNVKKKKKTRLFSEDSVVKLNESIDKNKKLIKDIVGFDFSDRIQQITSIYDVPMSFDDGIGSDMIKRYLNFWGPMYLFELDGVKYLYQDRGEFEWFIDEEGFEMVDNEIIEKLGISIMGLSFSQIINMYFEEEEY